MRVQNLPNHESVRMRKLVLRVTAHPSSPKTPTVTSSSWLCIQRLSAHPRRKFPVKRLKNHFSAKGRGWPRRGGLFDFSDYFARMLAVVRRRSAFRRMKPPASRWS
jgi:hypothetical protein